VVAGELKKKKKERNRGERVTSNLNVGVRRESERNRRATMQK